MENNITYLPWVTPPGQNASEPNEEFIPEEPSYEALEEELRQRLEKYATQILSRSDKSRKELEDTLTQRIQNTHTTGKQDSERHEYDSEVLNQKIAETLDEFESRGWLNEQRAVEFAVEKLHNQGRSSGMIRMSLGQRGFPKHLIEEALAERDEEDEYQQLLEIAQKRQRQQRDLDPQTQHRRLYAFLQRRGYSSSLIQKALSELF